MLNVGLLSEFPCHFLFPGMRVSETAVQTASHRPGEAGVETVLVIPEPAGTAMILVARMQQVHNRQALIVMPAHEPMLIGDQTTAPS